MLSMEKYFENFVHKLQNKKHTKRFDFFDKLIFKDNI